MSESYFKATRPDGTDFRTGTVDYAAHLASGEPLVHPYPHREDASGYWSVATVATDCIGMSWPCRLFRVEPVDPWEVGDYPNKRACHTLRVVEELPAHEALGPQGEHVAALVARCSTLTSDEVRRLVAAWDAARVAAWDAARVAARDAAWDAAQVAARDVARVAAQAAAQVAARAAARAAARDAAWALITRDLIATEHYDTLTRPWRSVVGRIHPDDPEVTE